MPVDTESLCLAFPAVDVGNFSRAFEHWIARSQGESSPEIKGSLFERHLVGRLQEAADNSSLPIAIKVLGSSVIIDGEEIDCLCVVGDLILVIEAKCLITPGDPIERGSFIRKLDAAASQARRKAEQCKASSIGLFRNLGIEAKSPKFIPLVVVPASYGAGAIFDGVPVIDAGHLSILISSLKVVAGAAKVGGVTHVKTVSLYKVGLNLDCFENNLRTPYQISRFLRYIKTSYEPFPSGLTKTKLFMNIPRVVPNFDVDLLNSFRDSQ